MSLPRIRLRFPWPKAAVAPLSAVDKPNTFQSADFSIRIRLWPKFAAGSRPACIAAYAAPRGMRTSDAASSTVKTSGAVAQLNVIAPMTQTAFLPEAHVVDRNVYLSASITWGLLDTNMVD
jgi:hypothetical protein